MPLPSSFSEGDVVYHHRHGPGRVYAVADDYIKATFGSLGKDAKQKLKYADAKKLKKFHPQVR